MPDTGNLASSLLLVRLWSLEKDLLKPLRQTSLISYYILNPGLTLTDKCNYHPWEDGAREVEWTQKEVEGGVESEYSANKM